MSSSNPNNTPNGTRLLSEGVKISLLPAQSVIISQTEGLRNLMGSRYRDVDYMERSTLFLPFRRALYSQRTQFPSDFLRGLQGPALAGLSIIHFQVFKS